MSAILLTLTIAGPATAEVSGLTPGPVELKSIGPMTFAEQGVLLVGDPKTASIYALDLSRVGNGQSAPSNVSVDDLQGAIANTLSASASDVTIGDLAVDPESRQIVLSATVGDSVHLLRVDATGIEKINLDKVAHAKKDLPNPPADRIQGEGRRRKNLRNESITDLAYFDGRVLVSGLSAGDSPSSVSEFSFPFADNTIVTNVEIYHAAHGGVEEPAIRAFIPMTINGQPTLLAGFTCTPLVRFPLEQLEGDRTVRGTTVAELGNRNRPLDLISYRRDGQAYLLMSNTARGVMKISTENIEQAPGLTDKVDGGGTAGQPFEQVESIEDVAQMDKWSDTQAVAVVGKADATQRLITFDLP